jgi:TetR/AcrR family transcriptional regulator, tetracycline repressor protein
MPNPYTPRRSPKSGAGGRPPLISRESILAAARSLPADKLTMPLVASQLGVNAAALYYHFESRAALLAELSSSIVTDFRVGPVDPKRWRLWLERTTLDLCRLLVANPVVFEIENWAYAVRISGSALENVLQGMEEAGFDPTESLQMWGVLGPFVYAQARVQYDTSRLDAKTKQQVMEKYATYLQQLPRLRAATAKANSRDPEQAFVKNVRWLISLFPAPRSARRAKVRQRKV